jgi:hypothetical protein
LNFFDFFEFYSTLDTFSVSSTWRRTGGNSRRPGRREWPKAEEERREGHRNRGWTRGVRRGEEMRGGRREEGRGWRRKEPETRGKPRRSKEEGHRPAEQMAGEGAPAKPLVGVHG